MSDPFMTGPLVVEARRFGHRYVLSLEPGLSGTAVQAAVNVGERLGGAA